MEMKYCVEHAIPHSRFLSWPEEDQDKVIEYLIFEGRRCNRCGTFAEEWLDPTTKRPIDPPPYDIDSTRCLGCVELDRVQEYMGKDNHSGLYFHLVPWQQRRNPEDKYG